MYCIIKKIKNEHGIVVPVIVLDNHDEILEFENLNDAEIMRDTFQKNSDSGYEYIVKKI